MDVTGSVAFAQPTADENQNGDPEYEYDIIYQSIAEDEQEFTAQFILKNNTDKVMVNWVLDFDYNKPIEESNDFKLSVTNNDSGQQYKFHYQMEGLGENKITNLHINFNQRILYYHQIPKPIPDRNG